MNKLKWDREFALEQAAEDTELLEELIDIFKSSSLKDFETIKKGVSVQDAEMVRSAAHSIKGAAASLGIEGIREIALEMENDSRNGSLQFAKNHLDDLDQLLNRLQKL